MHNEIDSLPPIPNSYQIDLSQTSFGNSAGAQLWGGEYPGNPGKQIMLWRIERFLEAGINTFVNLTEADERSDHYDGLLAQEAILRQTDLVHQRFPIPDFGTPSPESLIQILDYIDAALGDGRKVYVHCWGGIGRTGTVIGTWLVRHGFSGSEALAKIAEWRAGIPSAEEPSPETAEQRRLVLNWARLDQNP